MNRIEANEKYKGYEYLVYATPMGHRCGYVKIPNKHYLYKKRYGVPLKKINNDVLCDEPIGKRNYIDLLCDAGKPNPTMGLLFDVHGGITFSDFGNKLKFGKAGWLIGFDCAHCDDGRDIKIMDNQHVKIYSDYPSYGVIRTKKYVEQECKNLIDQIIKYFDNQLEASHE